MLPIGPSLQSSTALQVHLVFFFFFLLPTPDSHLPHCCCCCCCCFISLFSSFFLGSVQLNNANRLWVEATFPIHAEYQQVTKTFFHASAEPTNFKGAAEQERVSPHFSPSLLLLLLLLRQRH